MRFSFSSIFRRAIIKIERLLLIAISDLVRLQDIDPTLFLLGTVGTQVPH